MKMTYVLVGYVVVALVLAIAVDVAAKSSFESAMRDFDEEVTQVIPKVEAAEDATGASRKSCESFFELQKEMTVELALAFAPQKGKNAKKQRRKMKKEITAKMNESKEQMVSACMTVPQAEIDCVLGTDDAMAWGECGPSIAKLQAE